MTMLDYEALDDQTFFPQVEGHRYTLTAEFADIATARRAHRRLRDEGLAGERDLLVVSLGEEVSTRWGVCADDRIMLGAIALWIAVGAVAGALLGGLLGLVVGLILVGGTAGLWEAVLAGLIFGATTGGVVGGMSAAGFRLNATAAHRRHPELEHALLYAQAADVPRATALLRELAAVSVTARAAEPAH